MKFLKLDKKKGAGAPEIKGKYAYLVSIGDILAFPAVDEKGVRLLGNITFKPDCGMIPIYLSSTSQEFSYDVIGEDDEKSYKVKFMGTHPGTELEAMEFAKNQIEQPFLVLIPGCNLEEPWKLLGEITNPLIFTSTHKANRENSKFTFAFEQRIGSEFIYFSYGGVVNAPEVPGPNVPLNGFWAKVDASNIDAHIEAWRTKLGVNSADSTTTGPITADSSNVYIALSDTLTNSATIGGVTVTKTTADHFTFIPVSAGKLKRVVVYATIDPQIFHLGEGAEGTEAEDPTLPAGALMVKGFTATDSGILEDGSGTNEYKLQAEDSWRSIVLNSNAPQIISIGGLVSASFNLVSTALATAPKIGGLRTKFNKNTRDGHEIIFYNDDPEKSVAFTAGSYEVGSDFTQYGFAADYILKPKAYQKFKRKNNLYELLPAGETFDPTYLENQIATETAERIAFDDILAGEIAAEAVQRAIEDAKKLDKPEAPNNIADRLIQGDGGTTGKKNFQRNDQFFVDLPATISEDWNGCVVFFTSSGVLTAPNNLSAKFQFNASVDVGVSGSFAITAPKQWQVAPPTFAAGGMFTFLHRADNSKYQISGI